MAAKAHGKLSREQMAGLLGQTNSLGVKRKTSKRQWHKIKRVAAKRGLTIEGLLSGQPTSMAERSRSGIMKQAQDTVNSSFAPGFTDLDQQGTRLAGLDEKRRADADHYKQWLQTNQEALFNQARSDDAQLLQKQTEIQGAVSSAWDQAQSTARNAAGQMAGTVSNPADSTALDMSDEKALANQQVADSRAATAASVGNSQTAAQQGASENAAFLAGLDSERAGQIFGAQKDLQDKRGSLVSERGAETAKEVARLLDQEIDKTSANREFSAALQQLGIKRDDLNADIADDRAKNKQGALKIRETQRANKARERIQDINAQISEGNLSEKQRHNLVNEANDLRRIITGNKDAGTPLDKGVRKSYRGLLGQAKLYKANPKNEDKIVALLLSKHSTADPAVVKAAVQAEIYGGVSDPKLAKKLRGLYGLKVPVMTGANSYYGKGGKFADKR